MPVALSLTLMLLIFGYGIATIIRKIGTIDDDILGSIRAKKRGKKKRAQFPLKSSVMYPSVTR